MRLSRAVSDINGDFSRMSQIFPPRVFCAPAFFLPSVSIPEGGSGSKKLEWWCWSEEEFWRYLQPSAWIQYTNVTDGHTDIGRQQRPHLRTASRGKNGEIQDSVSQRAKLWNRRNISKGHININVKNLSV